MWHQAHVRSWFSTYLRDRVTKVSIDGDFSDDHVMRYSLWQGSIIGPHWFILYTSPVGNIMRTFDISFHAYPDDLELYAEFDPRSEGDCKRVLARLSSCIEVINEWMIQNTLPLLKDRQRFDAVSTSNLEVYKFRDWWILTYFILGHSESSRNDIWSMVNLGRTCVLLFDYFLCLKVNLDLEKINQLGESPPNFIFAVVNLDPIILEKRRIDGGSWPNNFVEKVNRGEDLRWVGSRCPLTRA